MFRVFLLVSIAIKTISAEVSLEDYALVPRIYHFNETEICPNNHFYCKIDVKLSPVDKENPSKTWRIIEEVNNSAIAFYRRDLVYRGLCVEKNDLKKGQEVFTKDGVVGKIDRAYCKGNVKLTEMVDIFDIIFMLATPCYIIFVIYCTIKSCNWNESENNKKSCQEARNKYLKIFSVIETWKDIRKPNKNEDFHNLRSMQGIRTLSMVVVIVAHTFIGLMISFSYNPEYNEYICAHPLTRFFPSFTGVLVQIFFVISAWLLAMQLRNIVEKNGNISLKNILILALNRYVRLTASVILVIFMHRSPIVGAFIVAPLYFSLSVVETAYCRDGWWRNLLFIQNLEIFGGTLCSIVSWYIAVDFQMYLLVLVLFYISQKFKIPMKYLLGLTVCIAMSWQAYTVLTTDFEGLLRCTVRTLPSETAFSHPTVLYSYIRTICNLATYAIGFGFGTIYYKNKSRIIFDTTVKKTAWVCGSLGFILLELLLYPHRQSNRVMEAFMAVTLRPLFSLGASLGLLGMATKTGGFVRKFFEWKPFLFLAKFTFSTYMFQSLIVFGRPSRLTKMAYLTDTLFLYNAVSDVILSFTLGAAMYMIWEHPCMKLQKLILPQVKINEGTKKIKDNVMYNNIPMLKSQSKTDVTDQ